MKKCRGLWPILAMLLVIATVFYPVMRGHAFGYVGSVMQGTFPWLRLDQGWKAETYGISFPQSDTGVLYFPGIIFQTDALRSGQLPLWNPYNFAGYPIYELGMLGISYPPQIVLALLFDPIWQLQIFLAMHLFLALAGMYLFLRRQGLSKAGAFFGGIVWTLNGFTIFWLLFEYIIAFTALVPWILLAVREAIARRSHWLAAVAGLLLGTLLHVGHLQLVYIWEVGAAIFAVWLIVRELRGAPFRTLRGSGHSVSVPLCTGLVALAVGAPIWLPLFDWQPLLARVPMTLADQLSEAWPLPVLVKALALYARPRLEIEYPPDLYELAPVFLFIGTAPLLFVPLGVLFAGRRGIALASIMVLLLAFTFGASWLIAPLNRFFPFFGAVHLFNFIHPALFCAAVLAAYGVTGAQRLLAGAGDWRLSPAWWMPLGAGLFVLNIAQMVGYLWAITPTNSIRQEWIYPSTPGIKLAREMQGEFHVMPVRALHPPVISILDGLISAVFGLRSISGYVSLVPIYSRDLWRRVENGDKRWDGTNIGVNLVFMDKGLDPHVLQMLSIGWLLVAPGAKPSDPGGADLIASGAVSLLYDGPDVRLMQVKDALPRAFLSAAVEKIDDPNAALAAVFEPQFDPRQKVIVSGAVDANLQPFLNAAPQADQAAPGTARIVIDRLNRVAVEVDTPRAAVLQLNDTWAPGWKATVNGRPARVYRSNLAFRAVAVPSGRSLVVFNYRPASVLIGIALAAVGVAFTGVLLLRQLWVSVRRKRTTSRILLPIDIMHRQHGQSCTTTGLLTPLRKFF